MHSNAAEVNAVMQPESLLQQLVLPKDYRFNARRVSVIVLLKMTFITCWRRNKHAKQQLKLTGCKSNSDQKKNQ